jgi:uncharacterized DUF497 family protein
MRIKWDLKKNEKLIEERNIDFQDASRIFGQSYHLSQKNDDPEQWRVIGWVDSRLITLIYEERQDEEGIYFWFVTAWVSTPSERKLFNES